MCTRTFSRRGGVFLPPLGRTNKSWSAVFASETMQLSPSCLSLSFSLLMSLDSLAIHERGKKAKPRARKRKEESESNRETYRRSRTKLNALYVVRGCPVHSNGPFLW